MQTTLHVLKEIHDSISYNIQAWTDHFNSKFTIADAIHQLF